MYELLLIAHGISGALSLAGAAGAIGSRLFGWPHRIHVIAGNAFTLGMLGVAGTGLVITTINPSLFLLALAVFLLYLAIAGWRYAKARQGLQTPFDKALGLVFAATFIAMIAYGGTHVAAGRNMGWVLIVFGAIGLAQAVGDIKGAFGEAVIGKERIVAHLNRMLGGTIGVITAFLLVQFQSNSIILWLGPTLVLTPLIAYWGRKVRGGWRPAKPPIGS